MTEDKRNVRIEGGEESSARAMNAVSSGSYDGQQPEFKLPNGKKCPTGGWVSRPDGVQRERALQREETLHMPEVQHSGAFLLLPARCAC